MRYCIVKECKNNSKTPKVNFYTFPTCERRKIWIEFVGREETWAPKPTTTIFIFIFIVRQKICPPCNSKTLYVMFTESRQESLEPKVRKEISFHLGGKISTFLTGLNGLYHLMQTH
jgi:hypothetical protein